MVCIYGCMCISNQCNDVNSHLAILSDKCCTQFFPHINRLRAHVAVVGLATVICLRKKKMKVVTKKRQRFGFLYLTECNTLKADSLINLSCYISNTSQ